MLLSCVLYVLGVDNWDWYEDAIDLYNDGEEMSDEKQRSFTYLRYMRDGTTEERHGVSA